MRFFIEDRTKVDNELQSDIWIVEAVKPSDPSAGRNPIAQAVDIDAARMIVGKLNVPTEVQLAQRVLKMLDAQRYYFAESSYEAKKERLASCRKEEHAVRDLCRAIITPPVAELFSER